MTRLLLVVVFSILNANWPVLRCLPAVFDPYPWCWPTMSLRLLNEQFALGVVARRSPALTWLSYMRSADAQWYGVTSCNCWCGCLATKMRYHQLHHSRLIRCLNAALLISDALNTRSVVVGALLALRGVHIPPTAMTQPPSFLFLPPTFPSAPPPSTEVWYHLQENFEINDECEF